LRSSNLASDHARSLLYDGGGLVTPLTNITRRQYVKKKYLVNIVIIILILKHVFETVGAVTIKQWFGTSTCFGRTQIEF